MTSVSIKDYKNAKKTDGKYTSPYYDNDKTLSILQEKKKELVGIDYKRLKLELKNVYD